MTRKRRILVYLMNWYPFEGAVTHIINSLTQYLKEEGYEITILTSIPYYVCGRDERWENYKGSYFLTESINGIKVVRTFVLSPFSLRNSPFLLRVINGITFSITTVCASFFVGKQDIIVTISHPPLMIGVASYLISCIKRCKFVYLLQDIYPDFLVSLGVAKGNMLEWLLKKAELFVYTTAHSICVLSSLMKYNLLKKGVESEKIALIPHFADVDSLNSLPKKNVFSKKHQLDSKFVVLLPGSLNYHCNLNTIFESADLLRKQDDVRFVFIDRGDLKEEFKEQVAKRGLDNVYFLPFQPIDVFPLVLASADACIVPLGEDFSAFSVPSKMYTIMASARPIIALAGEQSEVARIVKEGCCGIVVPPHEPHSLAEEIRKLTLDRKALIQLGRNGREHLEQRFNKNDIFLRYEHVINKGFAA
jgi:colanic acid biosynthesis glycosyl transferase WcaI